MQCSSTRLLLVLVLLTFSARAIAQVVANPNVIKGELAFSNTNPELTSLLGDTSQLGLRTLGIGAESVGLTPSLISNNYNPALTGLMSTAYQITVDTVPAGLPYKVGFWASFGHGKYNTNAYLVRRTSPPVYPKPEPGTVLNDQHCLSALRVDIVDSSGAPLRVNYASINAYPEGSTYTAPTAAYHDALLGSGYSREASEVYGVFDGIGISYRVWTYLEMGTDPFIDKMAHRCVHYIKAECDKITRVVCQVPSHENLGAIGGMVGVEGEEIIQTNAMHNTRIGASSGPFGNQRWSHLVSASPAPFLLERLVPSAAEFNFRYTMMAEMGLRERKRRVILRAPYFEYNSVYGVEVTAGQTTDMGDLFLFKPGYVGGEIVMTGPGSDRGGRCFEGLRTPYPDQDTNRDGIADYLSVDVPYHRSMGTTKRAPGSTSWTYGGHADAAIDSQVDLIGGALRGTYETILLSYGRQPSLWSTNQMQFIFHPPYTSANVASKLYSISNFEITNRLYSETLVDPGSKVRQDHEYCMSELTVSFRSAAGAFYAPQLGGSGQLIGTDHLGRPADYSVKIYQGVGGPIDPAQAGTEGYVRLCLPQGDYTFTPRIKVNNTSYTELQPLRLKLGCNQIVDVDTSLRIGLDPYPKTVHHPTQIFSGNVEGTNDITRVEYTLNGAGPVELCSGCGMNPPFRFQAALRIGENSFVVRAFDSSGRSAAVSGIIQYVPATATPTPSATATFTSTGIPTRTSTATASPTLSSSPTTIPNFTATHTPTAEPTASPISTPTATSISTITPAADRTPTATASCAADKVRVSVQCSVATPLLLWSPNHAFEEIGFQSSASASCEGSSEAPVPDVSSGYTVYADEAEVPVPGDGSGMTAPDALVTSSGVKLRSERRGTSDGRVYLIIANGSLPNGSSGHACCTVVVPHSKSSASIASVNTQASAARTACEQTGQAPSGFFRHGVAFLMEGKGNETSTRSSNGTKKSNSTPTKPTPKKQDRKTRARRS